MDTPQINLAKEMEIDIGALDYEWLKQPELFYAVADATADAKLEMDRAKEYVDRVRADLNLAIRSNPEDFEVVAGRGGIPAEASVSSAVATHPNYRAAVDEHLQAAHNYEKFLAACRALDHRKAALERLVSLHGQSYFAGPKEARNLDMEEVKAWRAQMSMSRKQVARSEHAGPRRRKSQNQEQ